MASPRERADRASELASWRGSDRRVTSRPADVRSVYHPGHSDPRVTTRPSDVRPHDPHPVHRPRRHHFHDVAPWPHRHHHDYVYVDRGGWWPRWYPYWDPQWYVYWWYLYDYYGGDAYPDYAEYARDAALRQYGPQWGLRVGGGYGAEQVGIQPYGDYGAEQVGIQPYGVPRVTERFGTGWGPQNYRAPAMDAARKVYAATGNPNIGYRDTPWGSEIVVFGALAGQQRWMIEQQHDTDVWYAATFNLLASALPRSELAR